MKLQQLQSLVAIVDHGSIRAAARKLHLSQAAVTKSMRLLEDEAGVPLLLRWSRGIDLTDAGRRLAARARVITRQVALAQEDLQQTAGDDAGSLRVGITPFVTLTVLGVAFRWFRQRYHHVRVELVDGLVHRVLPRIRDGSLDLAVVVADPGERLDEEFHVEPWQRIRQCVAVRQGHPALHNPHASALVQYEWITTRPMGRPDAAAMFAQAGVPPPERIIMCEGLQALALLRNTDAVSLMPQPLLGNPETHGLVAIADTDLQPYDLALMLLARSDVPLTRAGEYFAHCVEQSIRGAKFA